MGLFPELDKVQKKSSLFPELSSVLQNTAEQINIPSRMGRAAAVGLGSAAEMTGVSPMDAFPGNTMGPNQVATLIKFLQNASSSGVGKAAKEQALAGFNLPGSEPGFNPTKQQKPYAQIGETAGNIAAGAALGGATAGLAGLPSILADTGIAGGLSALTQAQQKGKSENDEINIVHNYLSAKISTYFLYMYD